PPACFCGAFHWLARHELCTPGAARRCAVYRRAAGNSTAWVVCGGHCSADTAAGDSSGVCATGGASLFGCLAGTSGASAGCGNAQSADCRDGRQRIESAPASRQGHTGIARDGVAAADWATHLLLSQRGVAGMSTTNKPLNQRAWLLILPVMLCVAFSAILPL